MDGRSASSPTRLAATRLLRWMNLGGGVLLLGTAACHLVAFPDHFQVAAYIGVSFLLYAAAATAVSIALQRNIRVAWLLGALLTGSAFVLYVAARTVGLPGFSDDSWVDPVGAIPVGMASFVMEALVVALYAGRALYRTTGRAVPVRAGVAIARTRSARRSGRVLAVHTPHVFVEPIQSTRRTQ
jgi:hypothetical protein